MKSKHAEIFFAGLKVLTLAIYSAMIIIPFIFILSVGFLPKAELFGPFHLIPRNPTLDSYEFAIQSIGDNLVNSFIASTGTALLTLLIAVTGGYVFARKEFPGKQLAFYAIITALMFPYVLMVVPITDIFFRIGLFNTFIGLIFAFQLFVAPFALWVLRDFFEKLPPHLEEAAQVYGCSEFTAFVRVVLPLSKPALMSTGFIAFVIGWHEFLFANMLTTYQGPRPATVQLFLDTVTGNITFWGVMMAETVLVALPTAILYFIARQSISETFEFG